MAYSKGQVGLELLVLIIILFVLAITVIYGYQIATDINNDIQADDTLSTQAKATTQSVTTNYPSTMDNGFIIFLVFFWVALLVSSFLIDTHPIFFIISIFILIFVFVAAMIIANSYEEFTADAEIATFASAFPKMNWVFNHFLTVMIVIGLTMGAALYAKSQV